MRNVNTRWSPDRRLDKLRVLLFPLFATAGEENCQMHAPLKSVVRIFHLPSRRGEWRLGDELEVETQQRRSGWWHDLSKGKVMELEVTGT